MSGLLGRGGGGGVEKGYVEVFQFKDTFLTA